MKVEAKRTKKAQAKQVKKKVGQVLDKYQHDPSLLVSILQDVQAELHYLPEEALKEVSRSLEIPQTRVYSVATFFKAFSLKPRGRHLLNVCLGTACHVRGAVRILDTIERELGVKAGETTPDRRYSLETVNCVGACALGPIVIVDEQFLGGMTTEKVKPVLEKYE